MSAEQVFFESIVPSYLDPVVYRDFDDVATIGIWRITGWVCRGGYLSVFSLLELETGQLGTGS